MGGRDDKAARLASALRANLKRRKTQARQSDDAPGVSLANPPAGQRSDSEPPDSEPPNSEPPDSEPSA